MKKREPFWDSRFGGEKELDVSVRENDAANIAALEHAAIRSRFADYSLMFDHDASNLGDRRDDRRGLSGLERADIDRNVLTVEHYLHRVGLAYQIDLGVFRNICNSIDVAIRHIGAIYGQSDGAIHRPGVEIEQIQFFGKHLAERGFARSARAVDSNDHPFRVQA